ncbi:MAG TPA: glycosyltransferase family 9 protein [Blastocatellia bacterium]|nr:glycosyltransferase family 9 protein [Blastocatellia bacterium]
MAGARGTIKRALRLPAEAMLKVYLAARPRPRFTPERVNRILVFAYHGLGNFIMYTPALRALRERYPQARIDLQVGNNTGCEEVLAGAGLFNNIYNLRYAAGLRDWVARAREIRATRYDLVISEFHSHSWPLALLVATSHAPYRLGHVTSPGWPLKFSRYSYVFNLPVAMRDDEHEIERYFDLVATVGAERAALDEARPFIHLNDDDRRFAEEFLRAHGCAGTVIGIQPGTSPAMRWKQWPVDRYRQIVERFLGERPGAHVILFGSAGEREMIEEVALGLGPRVSVAAGRTTVKQVAALIERCAVLVCNDSGLMHTAVAVATPVVAIYGPTDIRRTRPVGERHAVIRHALPCSPCFRLEGDDAVKACPHHDCLATITPDEVHAAVMRMTRAEPLGRLVQIASQPLE